jgi:hypothetical protein
MRGKTNSRFEIFVNRSRTGMQLRCGLTANWRAAELIAVDPSPAKNLPHFSRRKAFAIVETIVAIFVLALAAIVCLVVINNRDTARDKTAAIGSAPSAIDALGAELESETVTDLNTEIAAGGAIRVVYRSAGAGETIASWKTIDSDKITDGLGPFGPVYVATLSNAKLYDNYRAVEFDVSFGWIKPELATETASELSARLGAAQKLCSYRAIILAK